MSDKGRASFTHLTSPGGSPATDKAPLSTGWQAHPPFPHGTPCPFLRHLSGTTDPLCSAVPLAVLPAGSLERPQPFHFTQRWLPHAAAG